MTALPQHLPPTRRSRRRDFFLAVVFGWGLALLTAPAAQAFTIDDQSNATNRDGTAKYADPAAPVTRFGSGGQTTIRQGNTTLQFGPQRPTGDERYIKDRMFDPVGRPGDGR